MSIVLWFYYLLLSVQYKSGFLIIPPVLSGGGVLNSLRKFIYLDVYFIIVDIESLVGWTHFALYPDIRAPFCVTHVT